MNICIKLIQYNEDYIFLNDVVKNNILTNGTFIKITYATPLVVFNTLYIDIPLLVNVTNYNNKLLYNYDPTISENKLILDSLLYLETTILVKCNIKNKSMNFNLYKQLKDGCIKLSNPAFEPYKDTLTYRKHSFIKDNQSYERYYNKDNSSKSFTQYITQSTHDYNNINNLKLNETTTTHQNIDIIQDNLCNVVPKLALKISGVWINDNEYGLTYKFKINSDIRDLRTPIEFKPSCNYKN